MVIIIEDAGDVDVSSWKVLSTLSDVKARVLIVVVQKTAPSPLTSTSDGDRTHFLSTDCSTTAPAADMLSTDTESYLAAISGRRRMSAGSGLGTAAHIRRENSFISRLQRSGAASVYKLCVPMTYTDTCRVLSKSLNISLKKLPSDLSFTVHRLSGGDVYWMQLITTFIKTYGKEEFMQHMALADDDSSYEYLGTTGTASTSPSPLATVPSTVSSISASADARRRIHKEVQSRNTGGANSDHSILSYIPLLGQYYHPHHSHDSKKVGLKSGTPASTTATTAATTISATTTATAPKTRNPTAPLELPRRKDSSQFSSNHQAPPEMKLEFLVVCKLEKLSTQVASLARTASIIGTINNLKVSKVVA
jgi:hypothetical protein